MRPAPQALAPPAGASSSSTTALLEEWDAHLEPADPLQFVDGRTYPERVASAQKASRAREGMEIGRARIEGRPIA